MKRSDLGRIGEKVGVLAIMEPQTLQEIAPSNTFVKRTRNGKGCKSLHHRKITTCRTMSQLPFATWYSELKSEKK